jgi:circadian clock protein KaiC
MLAKAPTGIRGLDEITGGGLPRGRPTLVCGDAGSGKTMLGMEFLVRGATQFDEPGVFVAFEENAQDLAKNFASLGFDLDGLIAQKKLLVDYIYVERSEIEETGEYDLEGLFVRLGYALEAIGAKRIVLDTLEALFSGFTNANILRAELRRLFRWLKDRGVTAVITGERGAGHLTRHGLEEYVSDCVILLDHRVNDQVATRRLRIAKYRGSAHGTSEFPFLIGAEGLSVLPITSLGLQHQASRERVSTGIARLDTMLGGAGFYRGSTILVSGSAGTGKTSIAAYFVDAACRRGERALYVAFEESQSQIIRNMRSIGLDLEPWIKKGRLRFLAARSTCHGLELHLATIHLAVDDFAPQVLVIDPISNLDSVGSPTEVKAMLTRLIDYIKTKGISALCTSLAHGGEGGTALEQSGADISSLMDTWLLLRNLETGGERNRILFVLKSRGMAHSNQVREFVLSDEGIDLIDVYTGANGVLTGSARKVQAAQERETALLREQEMTARERNLERRRAALEAQVTALRTAFEAEEEDVRRERSVNNRQDERQQADREDLAHSRTADVVRVGGNSRPGGRKGGTP